MAAKKKPAKSLSKKDMKRVKGGASVRKAGKGQQEFLIVKLEDVQITSYQTGD